MKKRMLIFSLVYYPSCFSGAEAAVQEVTNRINEDDIEFDLVTLWLDREVPQQNRIGNVNVHRVGVGPLYLSKILFLFLAAWKARTLHKEHAYDGMWALMTYMMFPVVLARSLGVKVPYFVTLQDGDSYETVFERWFIRPVAPLLDRGFRGAAIVHAISTYLAEWPKRRGAKVPVVLIHNAANPNDFRTDLFTPDEITRARTDIGLQGGEVLIGNTARLVYQKGWEDCIVALTKLPSHVKLMIVGGGPDEQTYKDLVAEHSLQDRVIFIGQVDRSEVTKYRRMLDVFLMPSRSEGLGNAGLSSLASRIPLVATQVGGLAEYVYDPEHNPDKKPNAWVVEPDSPDQIAAAVERILNEPDEVKRRSENGHAMVTRHYQWDNIATDMREKIFAKVFDAGNHD